MEEIVAILFHILYTIATNTANTLIVITEDVAKILRIASKAPLPAIFILSVVIALVLMGFWYFTKSSLKTIVIAMFLLFLLLVFLAILT